MTSPIHFDTSFVVDFLKGTHSREDFEPNLIRNIVMISVLVEFELKLGQSLSQNRHIKQVLTEFLDSVIIVPLSSEIVTKACEIQTAQISIGKRLPLIDLLIGTTALVHNAQLFSNDHDIEKLTPYGLEVISF